MSISTTVTRPATSPIRRWVQQYPLWAYVVLAFGFSWLFLIPDALGAQGLLPFRLPIALQILMGYGPTLVAIYVTAVLSGGPGVKSLLSRLLIWQVGLRWYAVVLLTHPVLFLTGFGLYALLGGTMPELPQLSLGLIANIVLLIVILGLVNGEEIGWRGFALPLLQARHSALTANLILGVIAALFHLPLFFTPGKSQAAMPPVGFLLISLASAILFGWIYNNTRGSLLLAYLVHAAQNTWTNVLPVGHTGPLFWMPVGMMVLAAVAVVIIFGPADLRRGERTGAQWAQPSAAGEDERDASDG